MQNRARKSSDIKCPDPRTLIMKLSQNSCWKLLLTCYQGGYWGPVWQEEPSSKLYLSGEKTRAVPQKKIEGLSFVSNNSFSKVGKCALGQHKLTLATKLAVPSEYGVKLAAVCSGSVSLGFACGPHPGFSALLDWRSAIKLTQVAEPFRRPKIVWHSFSYHDSAIYA